MFAYSLATRSAIGLGAECATWLRVDTCASLTRRRRITNLIPGALKRSLGGGSMDPGTPISTYRLSASGAISLGAKCASWLRVDTCAGLSIL